MSPILMLFSFSFQLLGLVLKPPGANIKGFLLTILREANYRMVKNSFQ